MLEPDMYLEENMGMGDPNKMTPALGRHRHSRSRGSDEFIYKIDSPS